jgi:hypothetical protein
VHQFHAFGFGESHKEYFSPLFSSLFSISLEQRKTRRVIILASKAFESVLMVLVVLTYVSGANVLMGICLCAYGA